MARLFDFNKLGQKIRIIAYAIQKSKRSTTSRHP